MFSICPKAIIDLNAIKENYKTISNIIGRNVVASAVIKDEAYGLGAKKVAVSLYEAGCRDFWVAYLKEAIDVRNVLPLDANIYFLQGFELSCIELSKIYKIIPVINSLEEFNLVKKKDIPFVLHIDTGLTRLGVRPNDLEAIIPDLKNETISYVISHLACGNGGSLDLKQKKVFDEVLAKINNVTKVKASLAASGGTTILRKEFLYDLVRVGAFLYGVNFEGIPSKNVLSLKTKVLQKYTVEENISVGYNSTYVTTKKTKIAVISIGYADGIKRSLSNKGNVLFYDISGKYYKAKILGRVSMDIVVCDVTDIPDELTEVYKEVVILDENYSVNEMAEDAGTIPYEILTSINFKSRRFEIFYKK
jgi:alanine racemase